MDYLISLNSDAGTVLEKNQDCCLALTANLRDKRLAFAIVCDGMGGLSYGEIASNVTVKAFKSWVDDFIKKDNAVDWNQVQSEWYNIVNVTNTKLGNYGAEKLTKLGTTLTAVLFIDDEYMVVNVGDSRLYKVTDHVECITKDHTLVAFKVRQGTMTEEEARNASEKNVLLQCIGASNEVYPDFFSGKATSNEVFFLCSDGFRNKINESDFLNCLSPEKLQTKENMNEASKYLINLNKSRQEKDNISIVIVKSE